MSGKLLTACVSDASLFPVYCRGDAAACEVGFPHNLRRRCSGIQKRKAMSALEKYVVTVYASSSSAVDSTFKAEARALGAALAEADYALCVGGGKYGLMGAVTDGCLASGGVVDCVILRMFVGANMHPGPFRNTDVFDTMPQRKDGLYQQADAFIALPGGLGTLEELSEVMSWRQLELHRKPIVLLNTNG